MFDNDYHVLQKEYWRWIDLVATVASSLQISYLPLFASLYLGSIGKAFKPITSSPGYREWE